jgi:hypothetical protein
MHLAAGLEGGHKDVADRDYEAAADTVPEEELHMVEAEGMDYGDVANAQDEQPLVEDAAHTLEADSQIAAEAGTHLERAVGRSHMAAEDMEAVGRSLAAHLQTKLGDCLI